MKKFFLFGKKKKKANEQKEKEEEGYEAVDDDYNEDSGEGSDHEGKKADPSSSPLRAKRDPKARFSTQLVTLPGTADSIAATAARLSTSVAGQRDAGLSTSGGIGSSATSLPPGAASSTTSSSASLNSNASASSSPPPSAQVVSETDGVKRKVAAFAALSAANAPQAAPARGDKTNASGRAPAVSVLNAGAPSDVARSTAARRAELQRTRCVHSPAVGSFTAELISYFFFSSSHTTKRDDMMINSSMPSKEKIELLWSKYLVCTVDVSPPSNGPAYTEHVLHRGSKICLRKRRTP